MEALNEGVLKPRQHNGRFIPRTGHFLLPACSHAPWIIPVRGPNPQLIFCPETHKIVSTSALPEYIKRRRYRCSRATNALHPTPISCSGVVFPNSGTGVEQIAILSSQLNEP